MPFLGGNNALRRVRCYRVALIPPVAPQNARLASPRGGFVEGREKGDSGRVFVEKVPKRYTFGTEAPRNCLISGGF
jgi:hypothetical protein